MFYFKDQEKQVLYFTLKIKLKSQIYFLSFSFKNSGGIF